MERPVNRTPPLRSACGPPSYGAEGGHGSNHQALPERCQYYEENYSDCSDSIVVRMHQGKADGR